MKESYKMFFLTGMFLLLLASCGNGPATMNEEEYISHINEWDSVRLERLKSPEGWLNLAGLYWLDTGINSIGSSPDNDIVFPRGPERFGFTTLESGEVWFDCGDCTEIEADGEKITGKIKIFGGGERTVLITGDSLGFFIISRGGRTGIRLRDYNHPRIQALRKINRYHPDTKWIKKARFIESGDDLTVRVPDVLGDVNEEPVPGILEFEFGGEVWRLYPTGSRDRLFIIFADDTNAIDTYGAGRFLSAGAPDKDGTVYIDFNKAYNPPCAFSPYATCPLPPKENYLPFAVTAGEKAVHY